MKILHSASGGRDSRNDSCATVEVVCRCISVISDEVVCELIEEDEELLATVVGTWECHSFSHAGCCSN